MTLRSPTTAVQPAPPAPWQIPFRDYERGHHIVRAADLEAPNRRVEAMDCDCGSDGRVWETPTQAADYVMVSLEDCDIRDQADGEACRRVFAAVGQPIPENWDEGWACIDVFDDLPYERCRGAVPFDGLRFVAYDSDNNTVGDWVTLWDARRMRVLGKTHYCEVRDALRRGDPVPADVVADYPDLLVALCDNPTVFRVPGVRAAVLRFRERDLGMWRTLATSFLRWGPDGPAAAAAELAEACPDLAMDVIAHCMRLTPDILTPDVVGALLAHGNVNTRERALCALPLVQVRPTAADAMRGAPVAPPTECDRPQRRKPASTA